MSCQGLAYSRCRFSGYSTALSGVTRLGNNSILLISCMSSREIETLNLQQKRSTSEANRFSILDGWINLSHGTPFCQNNCATLMRAAFCWFCQITVASHYQRLQSIFDCPHDRVQHFRLMKLAEPYTCRADGHWIFPSFPAPRWIVPSQRLTVQLYTSYPAARLPKRWPTSITY